MTEPEDPIDESIEAYLEKAKERARAGSPRSIKIRRLVQMFGAERRGANVVSRIQSVLDKRGLVTDPSFTSGWIDNHVVIRLALDATAEPFGGGRDGDAAATALPAEVALTVSSLESASREVAHVDRNQSLERARATMLSKDYSQIAVVSAGPRNLVGAVSWESMAKAALRSSDLTLTDATISATTVRLGDDLIALVPTIIEQGFVFVVASDKSLCGIVTTADLGEQFATLAKPFFLLGEVERRLRHVVDGTFSLEELSGVQDPDDPRELSGVGDLTLGEIQRLLEKPENWDRLSWPVERAIFLEHLNAVREIRNEVMHFSPDPLGEGQVETLANLIRWLRVHDPR